LSNSFSADPVRYWLILARSACAGFMLAAFYALIKATAASTADCAGGVTVGVGTAEGCVDERDVEGDDGGESLVLVE
jgi:hypothetical protein